MNDQVTSLVNKVQDCEHNFYIHATPTAAAAASPVNLVIDRHSHNRPRWLSSAGRRCISALSLRWPKHVTANRIIDHVLKRDPNGLYGSLKATGKTPSRVELCLLRLHVSNDSLYGTSCFFSNHSKRFQQIARSGQSVMHIPL